MPSGGGFCVTVVSEFLHVWSICHGLLIVYIYFYRFVLGDVDLITNNSIVFMIVDAALQRNLE